MTIRLLCICLALTGCAAPVTLRNPAMQVTLQPRFGRVAGIALPWEHDVVHFDAASTANIGGEFLWTVAHHYWKPLLGRIWPPPVVMDSGSWRVVAVSDRMCAMERVAGPPLNVQAYRCYRLAGQRLTITQRLTRTAPSTVPVTLWNILQINHPISLSLPGEVRPLESGARPPVSSTNQDVTVVSFTGAGATAFKLGAHAQPAWVEARTAQSRIVYRVTKSNLTTGYPDDGCPVELWWCETAGYAELELLSPERNLALGESLENEIEAEFSQLDSRPVSPAKTTRSPAP